MVCTLEELRSKDVINVVNGENLGRIDDLQMNAQTASVTALILYGRPRLWGIFGPRDNCIIDFRQIRLVGKDVILVELGKMCTDCTNIKLYILDTRPEDGTRKWLRTFSPNVTASTSSTCRRP